MKLRTGMATMVGGLALATAGALVTAPGMGTAATTASPGDTVKPRVLTVAETATMDKRIAKALKQSKGGKRISVNQIEWKDDGAMLTLPLPGERAARAVDEPASKAGGCKSGWVCLFTDYGYAGSRQSFTTCAVRDLAKYGMKNNITSFKNYQTGNARSWLFYNKSSGGTGLLIETRGYSRVSLLGSRDNNKADSIKVC